MINLATACLSDMVSFAQLRACVTNTRARMRANTHHMAAQPSGHMIPTVSEANLMNTCPQDAKHPSTIRSPFIQIPCFYGICITQPNMHYDKDPPAWREGSPLVLSASRKYGCILCLTLN